MTDASQGPAGLFKANHHSLNTLVLLFMAHVLLVVTTIYSTTLFLSAYPPNWLAYLMVAQSITVFLGGWLLKKLFGASTSRYSAMIFLTSILLLTLSIVLSAKHSVWIPFVVAFISATVGMAWYFLMTSISPLSFGVHELKEKAPHSVMISMAGAMCGGLLVPLLLQAVSLTSLLYAALVCLLVSGACLTRLPLSKVMTPASQINTNFSFKQVPLMKDLAYFIALVIITQTLVDYVFKLHLGRHFLGHDLAVFFGYYTGLISLVSMAIGYLSTKHLLRYCSVRSALFIPQTILMATCIAYVTHPSIWTAAVMQSIKPMLYVNFSLVTIEVILNLLPSLSRLSARAFIKTVLMPIVTIITYSMLVNLMTLTNDRIIIGVVILLFLPIFYFIQRVAIGYTAALQQEAEIHPFNVIHQMEAVNTNDFSKIVDFALQSNDSNLILLGLNMIDNSGISRLPASIYKLLNHPDIFVRKSVISYINKYHDKASLAPLLGQYYLEQDREIKFWILAVISMIDKQTALDISAPALNNEEHENYSSAIYVALTCGDEHQQAHARLELANLVNRDSIIGRREAALMISEVHSQAYNDLLQQLIADNDETVCAAAIQAAHHHLALDLLPAILQAFKPGKIAYATRKVVIDFGNKSLPFILERIHDDKENILFYFKLLIAIGSNEADVALMEYLNNGDLNHRTYIVKELFYRACRYGNSAEVRQIAINLLRTETSMMVFLEQLKTQPHHQMVTQEITSRIWLAKRRALLLIAIATDPIKFGTFIPALLNTEDDEAYKRAQTEALDMLTIYIKLPALKPLILEVIAPTQQSIPPVTLPPFADDWLEQLLNLDFAVTKGAYMDNLFVVFALRQTDIFKHLPAEVLLALAEETKQKKYREGEVIFMENAAPDGLYILSAGKVDILRNTNVMTSLEPYQYFGELALIDDSVRSASAVAATDCTLIYLDKSTFVRITDDFPEIMRHVARVMLGYLRRNLREKSV